MHDEGTKANVQVGNIASYRRLKLEAPKGTDFEQLL